MEKPTGFDDLNTTYEMYLQSAKWHEIAQKRMEIDKYTCQCCQCHGTPKNPLEVHHLSYKYLYHEESRIAEDLVCLCRICHKGLHNVMNRITNVETGRRGWKDNRTIPQVHVFTINGKNLEHTEEK